MPVAFAVGLRERPCRGIGRCLAGERRERRQAGQKRCGRRRAELDVTREPRPAVARTDRGEQILEDRGEPDLRRGLAQILRGTRLEVTPQHAVEREPGVRAVERGGTAEARLLRRVAARRGGSERSGRDFAREHRGERVERRPRLRRREEAQPHVGRFAHEEPAWNAARRVLRRPPGFDEREEPPRARTRIAGGAHERDVELRPLRVGGRRAEAGGGQSGDVERGHRRPVVRAGRRRLLRGDAGWVDCNMQCEAPRRVQGLEYDIIVIGGGPAGLSAAVRAAWVAAPAATYRARVLVLDAGDAPGGLARWQPLVINTPGHVFTKRELKALVTACEAFGVGIRQERVLALRRIDGGFEATTEHGSYRALAAVIAAGCRLGHPGEHRLFHHNRVLWFHDTPRLDYLMQELDANSTIDTVCLCGAEDVAATQRHLDGPRRLALRTFAEPPYAGPPVPGVARGRLERLAANAAQSRLVLRFAGEDGVQEFETDVLIVDFNAYQKRAASLGFLEPAVRRLANGFVDPDRDMHCDVPGLFAAGDATGAPFGVVKAMSEGTLAGFAAYDYVCRARTGAAPNLFPFYPYEI